MTVFLTILDFEYMDFLLTPKKIVTIFNIKLIMT